MFNVIEADGHTLFEIPEALFGREMFWYAEVVDDPPETYLDQLGQQRVKTIIASTD